MIRNTHIYCLASYEGMSTSGSQRIVWVEGGLEDALLESRRMPLISTRGLYKVIIFNIRVW